MSKKLFVPIFLLLLVLPFSGQTTSEKDYFLPGGQSYFANLYQSANNVDLQGDIVGDVFVAANNITITGKIKGDVYLVAANIRITGAIDGSVRAVGQNIVIDSEIKRGVTLVGSNIYLNDKAKLGATLMVYGENVEMRGQVAGNIDGAAQQLFISGQFTHLNAEVSRLNLSSSAIINGNLNYRSSKPADLPSGLVLKGQHNYQKLTEGQTTREWTDKISTIFYRLLSLLLVGFLLIKLTPGQWQIAVAEPQNKLKYIAYGLLLFVVIPIIILILFFTFIGIPLALILLAIYFISLYLSAVYMSYLIGSYIAQRWQLKWAWHYVYLLGIFVYLILISLPWIGGLIMMIGIWWGLGGLVMMKKDLWSKFKLTTKEQDSGNNF